MWKGITGSYVKFMINHATNLLIIRRVLRTHRLHDRVATSVERSNEYQRSTKVIERGQIKDPYKTFEPLCLLELFPPVFIGGGIAWPHHLACAICSMYLYLVIGDLTSPTSVAPVAYQVILEPGIGQFREFEPRRVHTRKNPLEFFLAHKLTCGKRESWVSNTQWKIDEQWDCWTLCAIKNEAKNRGGEGTTPVTTACPEAGK